MRIRAAVLEAMGLPRPYAESRPLRVEDVELAPPGPGEVLVRIAAAGLCHSDLSVIDGSRPRPLPMVLGHEAAGVVEEVGAEVGDIARGDHVVLVFVPACGHCLPCMEGRPALCEPGAAANGAGTLLSGARRLARGGEAVNHHVGVSAFATHATVSRRSVVRIDRDLPLEKAALFGCAVLTGAGAVINTGGVRPGQTVAIVGLGGVGLCALLAAIAAGAREIVAIDLLPEKLAFARDLGATSVVDAAGERVVEAIRDLTRGGVDLALEFAGSVKALELAWAITRRGGTTITAGLPHPSSRLPVPIVQLVAEERRLLGSYIGTAVPGRDVPRLIELYRRGRLPVDRLVSGSLPLDAINAGFDRLADGLAIRQIVRA
jgi:alcohol dehydrogenase